MRINWGYVVSGVVGLGVSAAIVAGVVVAVGSAQTSAAQPDSVVALDYGADYDRAAAVTAATADRDARAAAEATRVAAEQAAADAAAAEAVRVAEQQRAQEQAGTSDELTVEEPPSEFPYTGPDPSAQNHTICEVLADGTQVPCQ